MPTMTLTDICVGARRSQSAPPSQRLPRVSRVAAKLLERFLIRRRWRCRPPGLRLAWRRLQGDPAEPGGLGWWRIVSAAALVRFGVARHLCRVRFAEGVRSCSATRWAGGEAAWPCAQQIIATWVDERAEREDGGKAAGGDLGEQHRMRRIPRGDVPRHRRRHVIQVRSGGSRPGGGSRAGLGRQMV